MQNTKIFIGIACGAIIVGASIAAPLTLIYNNKKNSELNSKWDSGIIKTHFGNNKGDNNGNKPIQPGGGNGNNTGGGTGNWNKPTGGGNWNKPTQPGGGNGNNTGGGNGNWNKPTSGGNWNKPTQPGGGNGNWNKPTQPGGGNGNNTGGGTGNWNKPTGGGNWNKPTQPGGGNGNWNKPTQPGGGTGTNTGGNGNWNKPTQPGGGNGTNKDGSGNGNNTGDHKNSITSKDNILVVARRENGAFSIPTMATPKDIDYGTKNYDSKSTTLLNDLNKSEYNTRKLTGDAFAPHLHPRDIGIWEAKNSTDGEYIRSRVPLQKRVISSESSKIISSKKDGRVYFMDTMRTNTSNSMIGTASKNSIRQQILGAMQYATDWIAFGGSSDEGTIYIPRAQDIDSLHRSGVKVHGTIFIAPNSFGGSPKAYGELLKAGPKVAAKKLIEIAKYYGFDGWMFNDENLISTQDLPNWKEMLIELHKLASKNNIEVSYYSNFYRYSGQEIAKLGKKAVDVWFNDYKWGNSTWGTKNGSYHPTNTEDFLDEQHSPRGFTSTNGISKAIQSAKGNSMWFFTAAKDGQVFKDESSRIAFFNGIARDTRDATNSGLAHYYKEYTTLIERKEFVTSFNWGEGTNFNINGKKVDSKIFEKGYSNFALSDLQPTWRYIQDKITGWRTTKDTSLIIKQEVDSKDAWFGSSVLSYKGIVATNSINTNKLYASQLKIQGSDRVEIMFKGNSAPKFVGWTNDGSNREIINGIVSSDKFANGYRKVIFNLNQLNSKIMTSFGVAFGSGNVDTKIGQIRYIPEGTKYKDSISIDKVVGEGQWFTSTGQNIRIRIETQDISKMYMVYANINGKRELIKITNSPAMVIKGIKNNKSLTKLEVVPYDYSLREIKPIIININA